VVFLRSVGVSLVLLFLSIIAIQGVEEGLLLHDLLLFVLGWIVAFFLLWLGVLLVVRVITYLRGT
jgi:threonine/homoserine/homoserine lactone efflux protein